MTVSSVRDYISRFRVVGITGGSGSGKTTFAKMLSDDGVYSIDSRFIGDSVFRKHLLNFKGKSSLDAYVDSCNQHNWWNWDAIETDIMQYFKDGFISLNDYYDRDTSKYEDDKIINGKPLIVEGAILGPDAIVNSLESIFFVVTPKEQRLARLIKKDSSRRELGEILARFLITEFSENLYYHYLLAVHKDKINFVDENYKWLDGILPRDVFSSHHYIPVEWNPE